MFRKFTKQRELTRAGVTRFATAFLTLKKFQDLKTPLRQMFASNEWVESSFSSTTNGKIVEAIILSDSNFWQAIKYCLKCVIPIYKVLRLVDGDLKPASGYIYEAMDRAKEQIKENLNGKESRYRQIWDLVDERWNLQLHRPLHAAAFYLNPRFQYDPKYEADLTHMEVKKGLYYVIQRMCDDVETKIKIDEQLDMFKNGIGLFGYEMAKLTWNKKQPGLWWESYGAECKELQRLAIRILSLTCSATGCERNWSTFDHVHSKKRNRLEQQRLNALVFVKYNLNLEMRLKKRQERGESYDPICLSDMESDDEWITEKEDPYLPEDTSWMDVHECFQADEDTNTNRRKRGPRNLNAFPSTKDKGKKKLVDEEVDIELIDNDEDDVEVNQETMMIDNENEDDEDDDVLELDV